VGENLRGFERPARNPRAYQCNNQPPPLAHAWEIEEPLFEQADTLAREMKISRSRLFALAIEDFVRRRENRQLLGRINAAYEDGPDVAEQSLRRQMRGVHRQVLDGLRLLTEPREVEGDQ